ncbi:MAG: hypothetical protein KGH53_02335 [Candidatus Micrarchaeota archaeon]|nr:hypothetical protein [Candidatus Micrarchaeota archaeon]
MNKEWIFWALLVVVIVSVSLYIRLYSTQTISMFVSIANPSSANVVYPFQNIALPITVTNNGQSAITGLVFSVISNGNNSKAYQLTIPVGKSVSINYNFTPSYSGKYNVTVIADPAKLYSVANRNGAKNQTTVTVASQSAAAPYKLLPARNTTDYGTLNLARGGFVASSFIYSSYSIPTFATTSTYDKFIYSVLNLTQTYIRNVSTAYATYGNGDFAYSVWIRGYVVPGIFGIAGAAQGYAITNYTIGANRVMLAKISNSTTLCSWYEQGWIKSVVYRNASNSCLRIYNKTIATLNASISSANATVYAKLASATNSTIIGNYSGSGKGVSSYSALSLVGPKFSLTRVSVNSTQASKCYGIVSTVNGTTYCSVYLLPATGTVSGFALIKTMGYIGKYNVSVFSLVNSSNVFQTIPPDIATIRGLGLNGTAKTFASGFGNSCSFNSTISCKNPSFLNSTLTLNLTNTLNSSIKLNSISCRAIGAGLKIALNKTLVGKASTSVKSTCYNAGNVIKGVPLNLQLYLQLNYTAVNMTRLIAGNATVNIIS